MKKQRTRQTTIPIQTEENARYTADQWAAIHLEGSNLLVSASAGSGKTSVLVQRILQKVKRGYGVDELLVVTFTEKAASEMKERLEVALQEMINDEFDPDMRQHFLQQIAKLPQANISTIDAFCKQVIQRYYFLIDLDPVYRLLTDPTENAMHLENVWETVKEELLGQQDPNYLLITQHFASDRKDEGIDQLIFDLYNKSRVHTNPDAWLDGLLRHYPDADVAYGESTFYHEYVKPIILDEIDTLINNIRVLKTDVPEAEAVGFSKIIESLKAEITYLEKLKELLNSSYKDAYQMTISEKFPSFSRKSKKDYDNDETLTAEHDKLKTRHDDVVKGIYDKEIMSYFAFDETYQSQFIQDAKALSQAIVAVEKAFSKEMSAYKFAQRMLDFSDIELFTYRILTKEVETEDGMNEAKAYYRQKFEEVMIDEYQDVNALQEAILQAVSGNPDDPNMFMVGDVKQSIYRFRFAEPGLFIQKFNDFADGQRGNRIILAENFRSRGDVLDFTNFIFRQVMDPQVGQIAYDEDAALKLGFTAYPEVDTMHTEVLLYEEKDAETSKESSFVSDDADEDGPTDGTRMQAELIAQSILEKVNGQHMIYDKKLQAERPITYEDIVILVATRRNHLALEEVFGQYQIPIILDDAANYFQRTEIRIMLNILKFIDNPYQDIPLAAILRSPILSLDEQALAKIRIADKSGTFYDAMKTYMAITDADDLIHKQLSRLDEWHQSWRDIARDKPIASLIWQIYTDTGFLDYVAGMPNGDIRQNNLHGFYQIATDYESSAFKGIFQFIRFIEKIQEKENDLQAPKSGDDARNAVNVFTIHHSKGLEFPLVYVYNISKRFNTQDLRGPVIYNDEVGIGVKLNDRSRHISYPNAFELVAKRNEKKDMLAEEMRKLYVALTRAEQQLVLVGMVKDFDKALEKWQTSLSNQEVLSANGRLKAQSILDWIGPALLRHHDFDKVNETVHVEDYLPTGHTHFKVAVRNQAETVDLRNYWINQIGQSKQEETQTDLFAIEALFADNQAPQNEVTIDLPPVTIDYAYQSATKTTSYQSVSELKRMLQDPDEAYLQTWSKGNQNVLTQTFRYTEDDYDQPKFMQIAQAVSPMAIGSASHLLMQKIDLNSALQEADFRDLFDHLVENQILDQQLWPHLKIAQLVAFFDTPIGKEILKYKTKLYREETFSLAMLGSEIFKDMTSEDDLLVHGTIDGFILFDQEIYLYDFKTDRVAYLNDQQQEEILLNRYQAQMDLYAKALETIWHRPVTRKMIISLDTLKTFFV
ncbi:helicase-exonuclease AddAB subunit AddA [Aerococcus sp. 1KP-2016]|uniref:helicase-exonuclease AddAB subunit AddA n=1 Tax=Aerococcus sp. 1KP-2016 TaxID=1981982 RepID=UPI000B98AD4D|nr:helicase-exonuclease AddAB subunit AddA [Aerococcus sp. 1KP-2016]OYQ68200.1 helicase-exonuclease AddAB subunit AddA [Aerococcus sp. 1KP-2016]